MLPIQLKFRNVVRLDFDSHLFHRMGLEVHEGSESESRAFQRRVGEAFEARQRSTRVLVRSPIGPLLVAANGLIADNGCY
jgi:hypothetical protein